MLALCFNFARALADGGIPPAAAKSGFEDVWLGKAGKLKSTDSHGEKPSRWRAPGGSAPPKTHGFFASLAEQRAMPMARYLAVARNRVARPL